MPYVAAQVIGSVAGQVLDGVGAGVRGGDDGDVPVRHHGLAAGFAPIAIGLCLTLIHLVSIPVSNTSVNPARSTGVALFAQTGALS